MPDPFIAIVNEGIDDLRDRTTAVEGATKAYTAYLEFEGERNSGKDMDDATAADGALLQLDLIRAYQRLADTLDEMTADVPGPYMQSIFLMLHNENHASGSLPEPFDRFRGELLRGIRTLQMADSVIGLPWLVSQKTRRLFREWLHQRVPNSYIKALKQIAEGKPSAPKFEEA